MTLHSSANECSVFNRLIISTIVYSLEIQLQSLTNLHKKLSFHVKLIKMHLYSYKGVLLLVGRSSDFCSTILTSFSYDVVMGFVMILQLGHRLANHIATCHCIGKKIQFSQSFHYHCERLMKVSLIAVWLVFTSLSPLYRYAATLRVRLALC